MLAWVVTLAYAEEPAPPPPVAPATEAPPPPPNPVTTPPSTDPEELKRIRDLEQDVERLKAEVEREKAELAQQRLAMIPKKDLEFSLGGYYRVRGYDFPNLYAKEKSGDGRYLQQRLRMVPKVSYRELAKFMVQVDALDDVLFGDNESMASTALFAGAPSDTSFYGQTIGSIAVSRAWMEVTLPVGLLRAGRMPSDWGMGLLANAGDGFDDTFGENHFGATYDRVLFATRPIAIVDAIAGKPDQQIPFYAAIGVDRLVEDPLYQYYGYECTPGIASGDPDYDPKCDSNGDGLTDLDHGYVDDTRTDAVRASDWWVDQADDVKEDIYVLIYRGQNIHWLKAPGDLVAGTYIVHRTQRETDSDVWILDGYVDLKNRGVHLQAEGLNIRGHTRAIALPGAYIPSGEGDPLYKTADIYGYALRLGYERQAFSATFEHGYASGDHNVADESFSGRSLSPDYNVGLLLYEEILARVTAGVWGDAARGLWSDGGVYNSRYIFPNVHVYPLDNWELEAAYLTAWPDKPDGAIIYCKKGDPDCAQYQATASALGWEVDAAVKHRWHEHVLFSLEGGYAKATDRLPLKNVGLDPGGQFFTLQSRLAYQF